MNDTINIIYKLNTDDYFTIESRALVVNLLNKKHYHYTFWNIGSNHNSNLKLLPRFYSYEGLDLLYLSLFIDLRSLKIFRLFRLFRLLKLTRYNRALDKFYKAILYSKNEFILFFILSIMVFYLASVGIYYFEHEAQPEHFSSIFASMWWAVATLTTVGYGDVYPVTVGGKIFTTIMLLLGLGIVSIPAGIISSALTEVNKQIDKEK